MPFAVLGGAIVPHDGEHAAPACVSVQFTFVLVDPVTVAVNAWVWPTTTLAVVGETDIPTLGVIVTVADADFVVSATEVAVTVTVGLAGSDVGAVYVAGAPLAVLVGEIVPHAGVQAAPF